MTPSYYLLIQGNKTPCKAKYSDVSIAVENAKRLALKTGKKVEILATIRTIEAITEFKIT
ncbi:MAG: hypothetical protein KBA33_08255 [Cloacibacterium sp.]|nr:hypothetical protein [Cloacibacterium sp.]